MRKQKKYNIIVVGGLPVWNQSEDGFDAFYNMLIGAAKLKAEKLKAKAERMMKDEADHQQENGIRGWGVLGRDSHALLHRDSETAKPAGAKKGGNRMRGRLKLTVEAMTGTTGNTALDKEQLIQI